jgi:hypothetical protein
MGGTDGESVVPGPALEDIAALATLAEEAATAARFHAWAALRLPSLVSYVAVGNDRAERLMHRMGADPDGLMWDDTVTVWRHLPPDDHEPDAAVPEAA